MKKYRVYRWYAKIGGETRWHVEYDGVDQYFSSGNTLVLRWINDPVQTIFIPCDVRMKVEPYDED